MGYGLSHSAIASLVEHIADLQHNLRELGSEIAFITGLCLLFFTIP